MTDAQSTLIAEARAAGSSSAEAHALAFPSTTWENLTFDTGSQLPSESISRVFNSIDSNVAWQNLYESSSYANFDYNTQDYWITSSFVIPNYFISSSLITIVTSSLGLGPVNTSAKVSIPVANLKNLFNFNEIDNKNINLITILPYNGVIQTIKNSNELSSSIETITIPSSSVQSGGREILTSEYSYNITNSYVVMYISASKNDMGSIKSKDLVVSVSSNSLNSTTSNIKDKEPVSGSDYINELHERLNPPTNWDNFSGMSGK